MVPLGSRDLHDKDILAGQRHRSRMALAYSGI